MQRDRFNSCPGSYKDGLTYAQAAKTLGECIMHALACGGKIQ